MMTLSQQPPTALSLGLVCLPVCLSVSKGRGVVRFPRDDGLRPLSRHLRGVPLPHSVQQARLAPRSGGGGARPVEA